MKIIGWIIAVVLLLSMICMIRYVLLNCVYLIKNKLFLKERIIQKRRIRILICLIVYVGLLVVFIFLIKSLLNLSTSTVTVVEENVNDENMYVYLEIVAKMPFNDEILAKEQTIWDQLIYNDLLYSEYLKSVERAADFDELRELYQSEIYEVQEIPFIAIDELIEQVELFYGTEILPFTEKTLEKVESEVLPLAERLNTDLEVFQNEFWLRASNCSADSSDECLYQAGGAADDAFKVLFNEARSIGNKMEIFYSSMTVGFYLACIKYDAGNINRPLVYYRIAEIYIYLEKEVDFGEDEEIKLHCLLMAEIFLMLAEKEYEKTGGEDIHKDLPYFSCYYAEILNKFIVKYDSKSEDVVSICFKNATQYLDSSYTSKYPKNRDSCSDILENLESKGYVKFDSELNRWYLVEDAGR